MNNQQAIDRLVKHLEWGWSEETVEAIKMGIHALKETQWIGGNGMITKMKQEIEELHLKQKGE